MVCYKQKCLIHYETGWIGNIYKVWILTNQYTYHIAEKFFLLKKLDILVPYMSY